jgi:hypothetical protein
MTGIRGLNFGIRGRRGLVNNQQRRARFDRYIARLDFRGFDGSVERRRFQFFVLGVNGLDTFDRRLERQCQMSSLPKV